MRLQGPSGDLQTGLPGVFLSGKQTQQKCSAVLRKKLTGNQRVGCDLLLCSDQIGSVGVDIRQQWLLTEQSHPGHGPHPQNSPYIFDLFKLCDGLPQSTETFGLKETV